MQRANQMLDIGIRMQRGRRDTQTLGLARYRRVVDRLDINIRVIEQQIGDPLALGRIPTMTGTMWLGFIMCGIPRASSEARSLRTRS